MKKIFFLIAGTIIVSAACSREVIKKQSMNQDNPWTGKYSYHTEVPGAHDGTDDYKLEIKTAGDQYAVSYTHTSMVHSEYKGSGQKNKSGGLDVFFSSFKSNKGFTKNFKPGNHMFTLKRVKEGTRTGLKLDWQMVPGDDLRKDSITLYRDEPSYPENE
jgi:hypothetical protein